MARFPENEIQRLKKEISVADLARSRGVVLTKSGDNLLGLCPFHDDRQPSLVITPSSNLWHCLGACQTGGSVIDFVMRVENASFRHAVELLQGGADLSVRPGDSVVEKRSAMRRKLEPLASLDADESELLSRVVDHYHATLPKSPDALEYLETRGLASTELLAQFRVGFADRTLGFRLPPRNPKADKTTLRSRLSELGILRETGHEHFRGMVVVPLTDIDGRVVQLYGRRIDIHYRPHHLYLPRPQCGVFNREGLAGAHEVILCEAIFDAMTFWVHGFRNVTTGYGIEGVTEEVLEAIVASGAKVVKIAFDRDEAGDRGAEKIAERLSRRGLEAYRVLFPKGMDANEYARKVAPGAASLKIALTKAEWMAGASDAAPSTQVAEKELVESEASADERPREIPFLVAPSVSSSLSSSSETSAPPSATAAALQAQECAGPSSLETNLGLAELGPTQEEASRPEPSVPPSPAKLEQSGEDLFATFGLRRWRLRAAGKPSTTELRMNVVVSDEREGGGYFVDTLDLYSARQRVQFTKHAADELHADERELRCEVTAVVQALELERAKDDKPPAPEAEGMTDEERAEAMALLCDPNLATRIVEDLGRAGIVGEETNKLVTYLATTSRKLEEPLAVVIQSSSAAGKSSLMEAVLALMPEEERVQYSAMTGQSLFYMSGQDLKHKILAIVEEEGAERAAYALKLLQSEGELTIASTGKDPTTGRHVTQTYRVEGPVMIVLTTTASEVDEELLNRCLVLTVDEGEAQTLAIHTRQRRAQTLEGLLDRDERTHVRRVHRNAQRLLRSLYVVNPLAPTLDFASHVTRTRRDHMKYLTLIRAVTLLFQYQRPLKTTEHRGRSIEYIECTKEDVELATKLARAVLGRSLDELAPQTRRLLEQILAMVEAWAGRERIDKRAVRFTPRHVREWTHSGQTQVRMHMKRLEEHEYLIAHRGRGPIVSYELAYLDAEPMGNGANYDAERVGAVGSESGSSRALSGTHRGGIGPESGRKRGADVHEFSIKKALNGTHASSVAKNAFVDGVSLSGSSYSSKART